MTATSSPQPETPSPVAERPRLLINGEPVRPEALGRMLSESVLSRLRNPKAAPSPLVETLELPPVPLGGSRPPASPARPPARTSNRTGTLLWGVLLALGLLLALFLLLR